MILVSVAHRDGVHLLRFKAADHFAGRPEASSHRCDGMPGRMLAPATTVAIMAPAMPAMTGVASPVYVVVTPVAQDSVTFEENLKGTVQTLAGSIGDFVPFVGLLSPQRSNLA